MSRFRQPLRDRPPAVTPSSPSIHWPKPAAARAASAVLTPPQPAAIRVSARQARQTGGLLLTLMGVYVFMHVAPFAEILLVILGVNLIPTILTGLALGGGVLFGGQLYRFWELKVGKAWTALLVVYMLAALMGDYPRQSLPFIAEYAVRFHSIPFLICATALSGQDVRRLMHWAGAGALVLLGLCLNKGVLNEDGRFIVPNTSLENPNDLALMLLLSGAYLLLLTHGRSWQGKVVAFVALPMVLYLVLQTGSRANFLTVIAALVVLFVAVPKRVKLGLALLAPVVGIVMVFVVPAATWQRLTLIVLHPEEEFARNPDVSHEIGSLLARQQLQERALGLTARHPLLGVGPQMFAVGVEEMVQAETKVKSGWQDAHNVYLQIAAENGVGAFFLYVGAVLWCLKTNYKTFRMSLADPRMKSFQDVSLCLLLLAVIYGFGVLFCNFLYDPALPILLGLTAANRLAYGREAPPLLAAHKPAPAY